MTKITPSAFSKPILTEEAKVASKYHRQFISPIPKATEDITTIHILVRNSTTPGEIYKKRLAEYGITQPLKTPFGESCEGTHGKIQEVTGMSHKVIKIQDYGCNALEEARIHEYLQNCGIGPIPGFYDHIMDPTRKEVSRCAEGHIMDPTKQQVDRCKYDHITSKKMERVGKCAMVLEKVGMSVYHAMINRSNPKRRSPSMSEIKIFLKRILTTLSAMRKLKVAHCDIKPENISVAEERSKQCILDFGCAEILENKKFTTDQKCSLWYQPPEILLNLPFGEKTEILGTEIDMWSLGCVLVEMYTGYPVFPVHDDKNGKINMTNAHLDCLGLPFHTLSEDLVEMFEKSPILKELVEGMGTPEPKLKKGTIAPSRPLHEKLCKRLKDTWDDFNQFTSLIKQMLVFNPNKRITAEEALKSPFLNIDPIDRPSNPVKKITPIAIRAQKVEGYIPIPPQMKV
jgi:serine/threonine protein kinase